MTKIIALFCIFVLCSCTADLAKTTNLLKSITITDKSPPEPEAGNLETKYGFNEQQNLLPRIAHYLKKGIASWYGSDFHGKKTASGEIYDMYAMTAAHKTLPISSYARVTNLENKRSVIVRINDRGPFHGRRVMDLSYAAAKKLDLHEAGLGAVEIKAIAPDQALAQLQNTAGLQEKSVYLQVGTFDNKKLAQNLRKHITAHNLPQPNILPSTHQGSTLYKVQMGPIVSPRSVNFQINQLAKLGITETQFVTETNQKPIAMIQ